MQNNKVAHLTVYIEQVKLIQFTKEDALNIATFLEGLCDCYLLMFLITVLFVELAILKMELASSI